jgi:hypothetical protein
MGGISFYASTPSAQQAREDTAAMRKKGEITFSTMLTMTTTTTLLFV